MNFYCLLCMKQGHLSLAHTMVEGTALCGLHAVKALPVEGDVGFENNHDNIVEAIKQELQRLPDDER